MSIPEFRYKYIFMEEEKEDNYSHALPSAGFHYPYFDDHHPQQQPIGMQHMDEPSTSDSHGVVNYMMNINLSQQQPHQQHSQHHISPGFVSDTSLDRLSFADVMHFADFGPKLAPNIHHPAGEEHFLKFPVLNDKLEDGPKELMMVHEEDEEEDNDDRVRVMGGGGTEGDMRAAAEDDEGWGSETTPPLVHLRFVGDNLPAAKSSPNTTAEGTKNKRKRPRSIKTSEEVESQRMTHIAVERNRRKQMNEHLRVLRSLMPGSYVQRGDQASIIGGAIEFVRELEQLLQCLESQKRRRLLGSGGSGDASLAIQQPLQPPQPPPFFPALPLTCEEAMTGQLEAGGGCSGGGGIREDAAESKSCVADVEVKVVGFDAMIKVLSRRRPGQLIKAIAALEDLQLNILHTNITTIEQTVLYSFNVKVAGESRFTAEDIASSVQQIFTFIHTNSGAI